MHRAALGDEILVYVYAVSARRIFSTFFCPTLRIVALDSQKNTAIFDRVVLPSRFAVLPATRLVLEMDPGIDYAEVLPEILSKTGRKTGKVIGEVEQEVSASALIFALFSDALSDLRRVKSVCLVGGEVDGEKLKSHFVAWERGKILGSAGFVIDYSSSVTWRIPQGAIDLSHEILYLEREYHDELLAASVAGLPWQKELSNKCIRCGRGGSWRYVLPIPAEMPVEISWRLERPENAVPLCHDCVSGTKFATSDDVQRSLVWALWGARFEALERWYLATQHRNGYQFPRDWSRENHPLWPKEFGGRDWAGGSGEAKYCAVREPSSVRRTPKQQKTLSSLGINL